MNTREICKLSYSNGKDPHWDVSPLAEHPAVTSFSKLTQKHSDESRQAEPVQSPQMTACRKDKIKAHRGTTVMCVTYISIRLHKRF